MARPRSETLTKRETEVMNVLWDRQEAMAGQVRRALPDELHDSTVRSLLRVLEQKGYVEHSVKGKAYVFRPTIDRVQNERSVIGSVLKKFFGGSAEALVLRLIEDDHLTSEQLDELRRAQNSGQDTHQIGGDQ